MFFFLACNTKALVCYTKATFYFCVLLQEENTHTSPPHSLKEGGNKRPPTAWLDHPVPGPIAFLLQISMTQEPREGRKQTGRAFGEEGGGGRAEARAEAHRSSSAAFSPRSGHRVVKHGVNGSPMPRTRDGPAPSNLPLSPSNAPPAPDNNT